MDLRNGVCLDRVGKVLLFGGYVEWRLRRDFSVSGESVF